MTQIFIDPSTEHLWSRVEDARAAQVAAESVANDAQIAAFAANQDLMDAANEFSVAFDAWARHAATRTKVKE